MLIMNLIDSIKFLIVLFIIFIISTPVSNNDLSRKSFGNEADKMTYGDRIWSFLRQSDSNTMTNIPHFSIPSVNYRRRRQSQKIYHLPVLLGEERKKKLAKIMKERYLEFRRKLEQSKEESDQFSNLDARAQEEASLKILSHHSSLRRPVYTASLFETTKAPSNNFGTVTIQASNLSPLSMGKNLRSADEAQSSSRSSGIRPSSFPFIPLSRPLIASGIQMSQRASETTTRNVLDERLGPSARPTFDPSIVVDFYSLLQATRQSQGLLSQPHHGRNLRTSLDGHPEPQLLIQSESSEEVKVVVRRKLHHEPVAKEEEEEEEEAKSTQFGIKIFPKEKSARHLVSSSRTEKFPSFKEDDHNQESEDGKELSYSTSLEQISKRHHEPVAIEESFISNPTASSNSSQEEFLHANALSPSKSPTKYSKQKIPSEPTDYEEDVPPLEPTDYEEDVLPPEPTDYEDDVPPLEPTDYEEDVPPPEPTDYEEDVPPLEPTDYEEDVPPLEPTDYEEDVPPSSQTTLSGQKSKRAQFLQLPSNVGQNSTMDLSELSLYISTSVGGDHLPAKKEVVSQFGPHSDGNDPKAGVDPSNISVPDLDVSTLHLPQGVRDSLRKYLKPLISTLTPLRKSVPGLPGLDYPILSVVPYTNFYCSNMPWPGFYADTEARCQTWHACDVDGRQSTFLCPNGTVFNQALMVCDWWYNTDCLAAPFLYPLNERLFGNIKPEPVTPYTRITPELLDTIFKP